MFVTLHSSAQGVAATRGGATSRDGAISRPAWSNSFSPRASEAEVAFIASRRSQVGMFHTNSRVSIAKRPSPSCPRSRRRSSAARRNGVEEAVGREVDGAVGAQGRDPADRARRDGRLERVVRQQRRGRGDGARRRPRPRRMSRARDRQPQARSATDRPVGTSDALVSRLHGHDRAAGPGRALHRRTLAQRRALATGPLGRRRRPLSPGRREREEQRRPAARAGRAARGLSLRADGGAGRPPGVPRRRRRGAPGGPPASSGSSMGWSTSASGRRGRRAPSA